MKWAHGRIVLGVLAVVVALVVCVGCMPSKEELIEARDQTVQTRSSIEALLVELRAERDEALGKAATLSGELRQSHEKLAARIQAAVDEGQKQVDALVTSEGLLTTAIDTHGEQGTMIDALAGQIAPWLPYELRAPFLVLAGIGTLAVRARTSKAALNSLATSTTKAAEKDPGFADAIARNAELLRQLQTPGAKKAIDAAQGKAIRLPV